MQNGRLLQPKQQNDAIFNCCKTSVKNCGVLKMNTKSVPGPKGSFVVGSLRDFADSPPDFLLEVAQSYGSLVKFQLLNQSIFLQSMIIILVK